MSHTLGAITSVSVPPSQFAVLDAQLKAYASGYGNGFGSATPSLTLDQVSSLQSGAATATSVGTMASSLPGGVWSMPSTNGPFAIDSTGHITTTGAVTAQTYTAHISYHVVLNGVDIVLSEDFSIVCTATVVPITTPQVFTFTDVTGQLRSTLIESNTITVGGINAPSPISITGGSYSKNGAAYTSATSTCFNGDTIKVSLMSSSALNTTLNATLTIGGISDTFSATTVTQLTIGGAPATTLAVGAAYAFTPTVLGGKAPYSFTVDNLPAGWNFNVNTGQVSVGAGVAGTFNNITIHVADSSGQTANLAAYNVVCAVATAYAAGMVSLASAFRDPGPNDGTTTFTATCSRAMPAGSVVVAAIFSNGATATVKDSVDPTGTWYHIGVIQASVWHAELWARVVPAGGFTTSTVFTLTADWSGYQRLGFVVDGFPDATGFPKVADSITYPGNGGQATLIPPAPSTAYNYQYAMVVATADSGAYIDPTADVTWHTGSNLHDNEGLGVHTYFRKATDLTQKTLIEDLGGFSVMFTGYLELTGPAGLAMDPAWAPGGGTGTGASGVGGDLNTHAALMAMLNAGVGTMGGATYKLAPSYNYGAGTFWGYDFSSNPITIQGQGLESDGTMTTFDYLSFAGSKGITLKNVKITGYTTGPSAAVSMSNSDKIHFDGVIIDPSDGNAGGIMGYYLRNLNNTTDITIKGRKDVTKPDVRNCGTAFNIIETAHVTIQDVTITLNGTDHVLISGCDHITIDGLYASNCSSGVGDHPDFIQTFGDGTVRNTNLVIKNCGFERGPGMGAQGYFFAEADGVLVQDCWWYNGLGNGMSAADCNNVEVTGVYLQPIIGGDAVAAMTIRGGTTYANIHDNKAQVNPVTSEGALTGYVASNNVPPTAVNVGTYTELDAWLAAHPNARRRA